MDAPTNQVAIHHRGRTAPSIFRKAASRANVSGTAISELSCGRWPEIDPRLKTSLWLKFAELPGELIETLTR